MRTSFEVSLSPQAMTLQAICGHMRAAGKKRLEDMLQELESTIEYHTHRHVRFAERPVIYGCPFPQVAPVAGTGELELRYHLQPGTDENESLTHLVNQIAILTILTTEEEERVQSLDPETAMSQFLNERLTCGRSVYEVAATLAEIIIAE